MKTYKHLFLLILFIGSQYSVAQVAEKTYLGTGLVYGSEVKGAGVGALAEFFLNDEISFSPQVNYFFPRRFSGGPKSSFWEINTNLNYYFYQSNEANIYGLGGINYANISGSRNPFSAINARFGLNLGLGTNININSNFTPFAEARYVVSSYDQVVLFLGIKFSY